MINQQKSDYIFYISVTCLQIGHVTRKEDAYTVQGTLPTLPPNEKMYQTILTSLPQNCKYYKSLPVRLYNNWAYIDFSSCDLLYDTFTSSIYSYIVLRGYLPPHSTQYCMFIIFCFSYLGIPAPIGSMAREQNLQSDFYGNWETNFKYRLLSPCTRRERCKQHLQHPKYLIAMFTPGKSH